MRVLGDREDPVYAGFSCPKGRSLPEQHLHPERLLHSQKRDSAGTHRPIESERAMDEISAKIAAIVERYGPRSVAVYVGTHGGIHPTASAFGVGWLLALGSRMVFTAATIDQPGKNIANALHGRWLGGPYLFDEADAWLIVGANPIVSLSGGISPANTARRIRDGRRRGRQLVVIDPRRTEVTRFADLHLQPRPGQDPALLATMLRVILEEERFDRTFVATYARGFESLERAVAPFDPRTASRRADVPVQDIVRAARIISSGARGGAFAGTGPNMSGHGNLTEYLLLCLNTLCGYWRREGEALPNPGVLLPSAAPIAQPSPPRPAWGQGEKLRVRGLTNTAAGLPTAALADEILLDGDGQVRALVCIGGNPAVAWPDQARSLAALENLELCVTLDIKMSATARLADYVIAPKLSLEVPGFSLPVESYEQSYLAVGYPEPYARYTPAIVPSPAGSDVIEEWEFFYGIAQRMGLDLRLFPVRPEVGPERPTQASIEIDMQNAPTTDEVFERLAEGSRVPLAEVKCHPHGGLFPTESVRVAPRDPQCEAMLELGDRTMLGELECVLNEADDGPDERRPFRLLSRRLPDVYNSSGHDLRAHRSGRRHNPAFMHPGDLERLGIKTDEIVRITSDHGSLLAVTEAAPELRRGVISMAHGFGGGPERDAELLEIGSNTGRLISVEHDYDPHTGIPRMSAIPVSVERLEGARDPGS